MKVTGLIIYFLFLLVFNAMGQGIQLSGTIQDLNTERALYDVKVIAFPVKDTLAKNGSKTDLNGYFEIHNLTPGKHIIRVAYFGYEVIEFSLNLKSSTDIGIIKISEESQIIQEVVIEAQQITVQQKSDTTVYNADAFKTNPDASVEELIIKMPGITIVNGKVYAHGEEVEKVLIDGDEFFGADATIAVRNLPAEIVHQIEVFDRQTDHAIFTEFDDGKEHKTLNIITKPDKKSGQFGKLYGGYGTEERYSAGGNINFFKEKRKVSVIGLSNNINQQNFSNEDILGIHTDDGGSGADNFIGGQQRGVSTTHSAGVNYANKWSDNTLLSGSYFFNQSTNERSSETNRQYIVANNEGQRYFKDQSKITTNINHRANLRLEHNFDSNNSIIFKPKFKYQQNSSVKYTDARTNLNSGKPLNTLMNENEKYKSGINLKGNLLYRHRFNKKGRTITTQFKGRYKVRDGQKAQLSQSEFYSDNLDSINYIDQISNNAKDGIKLSSNIAFTERIGKSNLLQINYTPIYSRTFADQTTYELNPLSGEYTEVDTLLSSLFDSEKITQRIGLSYRYKKKNFHFQFRLKYQNSVLINEQTLPSDRDVRLEFNNILPMASIRYKFSKSKNLRIFYKTKTNTPSVSQLQDVVDNSNPLRLSSGNVELEQEFDHRMIVRYSATNASNASSFFVYLRGDYNFDYITNATIIAEADTLLQGDVLLREGTQYTRPVNLDGAWRIKTYSTYGRPINKLKSNFNINLGAEYRVRPGMINEVRNESNTLNLNSGVTLSSNISENFDFKFGYTYNYNIVENTVIPQASNMFQIHTGSAYLTWLPWKKFVISTSFHSNTFQGLEENFNQTILLFNAGLGFKFLKNESAEIRLSGFDILNNNNSIVRKITNYYIEDLQTQVLNRYFMLTFTYNLRNYVGKNNRNK